MNAIGLNDNYNTIIIGKDWKAIQVSSQAIVLFSEHTRISANYPDWETLKEDKRRLISYLAEEEEMEEIDI